MDTKFYISLKKVGRDSFEIIGVTRNAQVNQFARKNKVVNKRGFAKKLSSSKIFIK